MSLSATSTPAEIEAEYLATAGYDAEDSPDLCRRFIVACRAILLRRPSKASRGASDSSQTFEWNIEAIKAELDAARQWLAFAPAATSRSIVHPDFGDLRGQAGWTEGRTYGTDAP